MSLPVQPDKAFKAAIGSSVELAKASKANISLPPATPCSAATAAVSLTSEPNASEPYADA